MSVADGTSVSSAAVDAIPRPGRMGPMTEAEGHRASSAIATTERHGPRPLAAPAGT